MRPLHSFQRMRTALAFALLLTAVNSVIVCGVTLAWRDADIRSFDARLLGLAYEASQELAKDVEDQAAAVTRDVTARGQEVLYVEVVDDDGESIGKSSARLAELIPIHRTPEPPVRAEFQDLEIPELPARIDSDRVVRHVALPFHDEDGDVYVIHAVARTTGSAELMRTLVERLQWLVPLGLATAFVVAMMIARRALRPFEAVTAAAADVSPETLRRGIQVDAEDDEVARLQASLNEALERIDTAFAAQSRFVANVSHELKSPIAVLLAESQILDARTATGEEVEAFRAGVETEMRHLGRTVASVLLLARPGGESQIENPRATPLLDVAVESVRHSTALAERYSVRLVPRITLEDDARPPIVHGNHDLLCTMLENLVVNAVRFSPKGGSVHVDVVTRDDCVDVAVRDEGPGIPEESLERIFDRFVRVRPDDLRTAGSGLGLNIASTVARAHGGTIAARNRQPSGCEFVVSLPVMHGPDDA